MFRGLTAVQIDTKGRLTIPARYRVSLLDQAETTVVITIDPQQRCLLLYPTQRWLDIEDQLEKLSSFHPASRRIQRLLIGHATDIELDNQGRILLPPLLREYAHLDKAVMLVGQGKKFEIWNSETWEINRSTWLTEAADDENNLSSDLASLSL